MYILPVYRDSPLFPAFPAFSGGKALFHHEMIKATILQEGSYSFMKFRRFLSGLIFGSGCALSFIGLMAVILPTIDNPQLQLVLAGFQLVSVKPLVERINGFMRFVLSQSWQFFYLGLLIAGAGTLLLLRFMPKPEAASEPETTSSALQQTQTELENKPNPYVKVIYHELAVTEPARKTFRPEPILERNVVENASTETDANETAQPYFSPRFTAESRALESESGAWSQSGSRILIRAVPKPAPDSTPEDIYSKPEPVPHSSAAISQPSSRMTPPRIRSTMGRHTH